jgi:ketopantoate reductase
MKKSDLKFLVVGAGAIGGIAAAMLKKARILFLTDSVN